MILNKYSESTGKLAKEVALAPVVNIPYKKKE